jgi:uncharacterized membrane protein
MNHDKIEKIGWYVCAVGIVATIVGLFTIVYGFIMYQNAVTENYYYIIANIPMPASKIAELTSVMLGVWARMYWAVPLVLGGVITTVIGFMFGSGFSR